MINKNIIFLIGAIFLIGLNSCKKFLEISPENETEIPSDKALNSENDFQMLLNSSYDVLRDNNFMGGNHRILSDLLADEINGSLLTGDYNSYYTRGTGIFISATRTLWANPYRTIYRSNVLLEELEKKEFSASFENRMKGEALFLRALCHFELVRLFGQPYGYSSDNSHAGIPIRIKASQEAESRSSVKQVYDQVIADLKEAENLLNDGGEKCFATKKACQAYLARVYFQMNNFQEAYNYSSNFISVESQLDTNLLNRFSVSPSSEYIFYLSAVNPNNAAMRGLFDNYNYNSGRANLPLSEDAFLAVSSEPNDARLIAWFEESEGEYFTKKFNECGAFGQNPIVHLTEMYLTYAESAAEINNTSEALRILNYIRLRAKLSPFNSSNSVSLIEEIRKQRRIELVIEGDRIQQIKRIGAASQNSNTVLPINNLTVRNAPWNCNGLVVQLPDEEVQGNVNITLNPQGGCN